MRQFNKILMSGVILASAFIYADDPQPYSSYNNLPYTPYYVQDGYVLYDLANTHNAAVVIDVESQDGSVARFLAQQASNLPSLSTIYCVNAWTSFDPSKKHLYQRFLSNVKQENTSNLIVPVNNTSSDAAWGLNVKADLISIVGANDKDVIYRDILAWYPHLTENGVMCGNNWNENSVEVGVTRAADALDLTIKLNDNVWYLVKNPS